MTEIFKNNFFASHIFAAFTLALLLCVTGCGKKNAGEEVGGELSIDTGVEDSGSASTSSAPVSAAKKKPVLKVQVVKGQQEGDIDIYVTNMTDANITNCKVELFDGVKIDVDDMKPGQGAMCAIGGEIPKTINFVSDQFASFEFTLPAKPEEKIDMSDFKWADQDDGDDSDSDESVAPGKRVSDKEGEKKSNGTDEEPGDLMDFGDDDDEETAPGKRKQKK